MATGIYLYAKENVTETSIQFRRRNFYYNPEEQFPGGPGYDSDDEYGSGGIDLEAIFGILEVGSTLMKVGKDVRFKLELSNTTYNY